MSLRRISLSLAGLFVLVATDSAAAPTVGPTKSTVPQKRREVRDQCPTPDEDQCLEKGYLDSMCGQRHIEVCKPFAQAAMKAHHDGKAVPKLKMLRPNATQMPKDVTRGKYFAYKKVREVKKKGSAPAVRKVYEKANDVLRGLSGMNMSNTPPVDRVATVDPNTAAQFHREPAWKENGRAVRSCREYAYARNYGVTRFVDGASACKGDRECVFDVAFMNNPPGIANRKLKNEDGVPLDKQLELPREVIPKNDFFVPGMDEFVHTLGAGTLAATEETTALADALREGAEHYSIGLCRGSKCDDRRKFHDVWDWHQYLHDENESLSQAEAEEFNRRRADLRALLDAWNAAVAKEASIRHQREHHDLVLPLDIRATDVFERYRMEEEFIERGRVQMKQLKRRFGPSILHKSFDEAMRQAKAGASLPAGVLAAPMPRAGRGSTPTKSPTNRPKAQKSEVDRSTNPCLTVKTWGLETGKAGPISCAIGQLLRSEWKRKVKKQRSCVDPNDPGCDWTPQMFEAGILEKIPKLDAQVADEAFCNKWADSLTFVDSDKGVATVTQVKGILQENKRRIEQELETVADYVRGPGEHGLRLGKDWEGGDYTGDPAKFAAGYDYDLGWAAQPAEAKSDDQVCSLRGSAHAEMGFDAYILGKTVNVADGAVWAEAKPGTQGNGRVKAYLQMFDQSVFNTDGWKLAQSFGDDPASNYGVEVPSFKPRFDVYVGVPVSGQMWGELLFGSTLDVSASSPVGCVDNPTFSIVTKYTPFLGTFGLGQVGVGIAGVASAGIRASLTLLMMYFPLTIDMKRGTAENRPALRFDSSLSMLLSTLGGRVSLYLEFLMVDEEFELFRWKGFTADVPLMPELATHVTLAALEKR